MGRSHRLMSSLKLLASPPIDLATSSSSVHVMRSAKGPFSVVLRRGGPAYGRLALTTRPIISTHSLSSTLTEVYGRPPTEAERPMTYNQSVGARLSTSELQTHASECDPQSDTPQSCP